MPLTYREKKYYSPAEFAANYSVSVQTVYAWIKNRMMTDGTAIETIKLMDKTFLRTK